MHSVHKILSYRQKSEGGFVLIAALMAVMILMAVGFFILTTTSQDLRMSSRLVGERKAFSAAEAGVHETLRLFTPTAPTALSALGWRQVDITNDPSTRWRVPAPAQRNTIIPESLTSGYSAEQCGANYDLVVEGQDTNYGSSASIRIGASYQPSQCDTQQGTL